MTRFLKKQNATRSSRTYLQQPEPETKQHTKSMYRDAVASSNRGIRVQTLEADEETKEEEAVTPARTLLKNAITLRNQHFEGLKKGA